MKSSNKKILLIVTILTVLCLVYSIRAVYVSNMCKNKLSQLPTEQSEYGDYIVGADTMITTCLKEQYVVPLEILK